MNVAQTVDTYITNLASRRRKPVKPATLSAYRSYSKNWVDPLIGVNSVEAFGNKDMKMYVDQLVEGELSPKTIREIVTMVKQAIASQVDDNGDRLYPKAWNGDFIDLPDLGIQAQPTLTPEQLTQALGSQHGVFYAFLAGTGLRIGEAACIRITDDDTSTAWDPVNAVLRVRKAVWRGSEQAPKTAAAVREVDLDPRLNDLLLRWVERQPMTLIASPYLFGSNGHARPLSTETRRHHLSVTLGLPGFHAFRRFRITRLRELGTPEDIIRYWVGHAGAGITDRYSKLAECKELRKQWAKRSGLGFELPEVVW